MRQRRTRAQSSEPPISRCMAATRAGAPARKPLASMRAASCSEALVLQYPPLLGRVVALFEELKAAIWKGDLEATSATSEQLQTAQAKLLELVQSIWKSAKRRPQSPLN